MVGSFTRAPLGNINTKLLGYMYEQQQNKAKLERKKKKLLARMKKETLLYYNIH